MSAMEIRTLIAVFCVVGTLSQSLATEQRTIVVREHAVADLLNGALTFKLVKINGYSIKVRVSGKDMVLKVGQSFSGTTVDCSVIFEEIATETRLARFKTNCP